MNISILTCNVQPIALSDTDIMIESATILIILFVILAVIVNAHFAVSKDRVIYFDTWLSIIWAKVAAMHLKYNNTSRITAELEEAKCKTWFYLHRSQIKQQLTDEGVLEDGWGVKSVIIEAVYNMYCEARDSADEEIVK